MTGEMSITEHTFSIHHFDGGWLNSCEKEYRKRPMKQYLQILKRMNENE